MLKWIFGDCCQFFLAAGGALKPKTIGWAGGQPPMDGWFNKMVDGRQHQSRQKTLPTLKCWAIRVAKKRISVPEKAMQDFYPY